MAVSRRQKENDTFNDIAGTLPIEENAKELDKASVLRIAIHYLKLRDVLADCETESNDDKDLHSVVPNFSKDVLQALDGFLMMISKDGRILYVTESVSQYLGLRQVDVIGVHLQDIVHPQDYSEVASIFQSQGRDIGPEMEALGKNPLRRNFVVRMRCAFTPSVRSITRCSNFKPIYCSGFLKFSNQKVKDGEFLGMVTLCKLASVMKVRELCVGAFFKTKHSLDLGYTAVDTRIRWILGFDPAEMVGLKAYEYFHPEDLLATSSCHTTLLAKGRSHSPCYRFMTRGGEWVWVRSKSSVTYDSMTHLPNGLSIYTWIVRYDEEDERMKIIMEGKDPGNVGVKDTTNLTIDSSSSNMNIQELCNPHSSSSSTLATSKPLKLKKQEHSLQSVSPIPQPPPNINPFQSSPVGNQQYDSISEGQDPFMGVLKMTTMSFANCRQSSLESQPDSSPPYSSTNSYSYTMTATSPYSQDTATLSPAEYYNSPVMSDHSPFSSEQSIPYYPQSNAYAMPSFAVNTTVYTSGSYGMDGTKYMPHQEMLYSIKQEPMGGGFGGCYYDQQSVDGYYMTQQQSMGSHISKIKSKYSKVGVAGGHSQRVQGGDDPAIINNISQWLQHSVH